MMVDCECISWARDYLGEVDEHHKNCEHYIKLSVYQLFDGETHWVVASNKEKAVELHAKDLGYKSVKEYEHDLGGVDVDKLSDDEELVIQYEGYKEAKTCREWMVTEKGCLCSTIY